jgi:transcription-repair coupling factor (superfamily II helicase)
MNRRAEPWEALVRATDFTELERRLRAGERGLTVTGLVDGSRALILTLLAARLARPLLLVVPDDAALAAHERDLAACAALTARDPRRVVPLPALDHDPYDSIPPHPEVVRERVVALGRLARRGLDVLLVPARGLLSLLPSPEEWDATARVVRVGDELAPDRFVLSCLALGYRRTETVSAPGEVSRRGGIVDVFPPSAAEPVRIELFGDTVDSLRSFDTDHQRSTGQLHEIELGPALENPPTDAAVRRVSRHLEARIAEARGRGEAVREYRERLAQLEATGWWPGFESLAALTAERPVPLFDHARGLLLVLDEPERALAELQRAATERDELYRQSENRILPPPRELFAEPRRIAEQLERQADLRLEELAGASAGPAVLHLASRTARNYAGRIPELVADLRAAAAREQRALFVMRAAGSADRLQEILGEHELGTSRLDRPHAGSAGPFVGVGALRAGFELPGLGLVVLTEREVFGEERRKTEPKSRGHAAFVSDFRDLRPGSHVVHVDHGIARYAGLGRPKGGSLNRDFMVLEFAAGDRLFVPVDRLDLVQKYSGVSGRRAVLDRLGGPGWGRVKARARKSVEAMARELLELYARRKAARGIAFGADTPWQRELEDAFPYELTPDQERALGEIKQDMSDGRVMDRLLVGDVGFGKTELAVRAAFKAVMDGHQVALLTPTTVLALQHYETFLERYAAFPVRVEMVSRFRSASETKRILRDVEAGSVDVLIGTHRLLSKDVTFRRLGLLVVDEEQRFGVAHKERLKRLAIGMDVLSMTATPIPRTLQMSLAGVRDLSVIETPPPGRMAIQTYLIPFRKAVVAQAIRHELRREGQVFVVHNRIETLPALARAIGELVPEARVVTAHGQLHERALESVMLRFVQREADVLLTTTIIENGLDIPNANTIIVNRADRMGLAQLYQLRGRVGRSQRHAYAYFIVPARQNLSSDARQRLRALQEFSDLGAGFRLAAADLEIRGAGELLGSRQHGHIAALGFDLYCQMLERAVQEQTGEPWAERQPASLNLGVDIKVPESYLPDPGDRLVLYKRLAQARTESEVDGLQAETEDRFGHLPQTAQNLFDMGRLRVAAEQAQVKSVDLADDQLQIRFHDRPPIEPERILDVLAGGSGSLTPSGMLQLPAPARAADRIDSARSVLQRLLERGQSCAPGS